MFSLRSLWSFDAGAEQGAHVASPSAERPSPEPSPTMDPAQALALKERGNLCFKKGMFQSAVELYSQAIKCDSSCAVYYTNRALCYKKLGKWTLALEDAKEAAKLQYDNIKAHFLMGEALLHLVHASRHPCSSSCWHLTTLGLHVTACGAGSMEEGLQQLTKARSLATAATTIRQEIEDAIHKGNKMLFLRKKEERSKERAELASFLRTSLETLYASGALTYSELQQRVEQLDRVVEEAEASTQPFEVPSCLSCSISMAIMNDPVITPSGITYEKSLLREHLRHNGQFDPITRKPCPSDSLVPNYGLKEVISWFLKKYPWAYDS